MEYMESFRQYDWLWKNDKDAEYNMFIRRKPDINDYEAELQRFNAVQVRSSSPLLTTRAALLPW